MSYDLLLDRLTIHTEQQPEKTAIGFLRKDGEPQLLTYAQLSQRMKQLAAFLLSKGLKPGDRYVFH